MHRLPLLFLVLFSCSKTSKVKLPPSKIVTDTYFGKDIEDPYRYMENLKDTILISWLKDKNSELETIHNLKNRSKLLKTIQESDSNGVSLSRIERTNNDHYFYLKREPEDNSPKLFHRKPSSALEELLYDPRTFNPNSNKEYIINYIKPSWDGSKVVVSLTESDKGISEMIVIDVSSKTVYPHILNHCWPSGIGKLYWLPDNSGFVYTHIPELDKTSKSYLLNTSSVLYKIGDDPKKLTPLISKKNNPKVNIKEEDFCIVKIKKQSAKYLFSLIAGPTKYNDYYYAPIEQLNLKNIDWKPLYRKTELIRLFTIVNNDIIFLTAKNASNFKICKTSLIHPNFENPEVLVKEDPLATITNMKVTADGLFFVKTKNGVQAKLYHLDNKKKIKEVILPKASGSVAIFSKGPDYNDLWIKTEGWTSKKERYNFNSSDQKFTKINLISNSSKEETEDTIIQEIEVPSHDGTMVPLSIIYKKDLKKDGNSRLLINAYGAYGWENTPYKGSLLTYWLNEGGIYAVAHVRGGGEKGNAWYKAGHKTTKPNTWKDLNACVEYLIEKKYTTASKVVTWGASAGGICIARAITERPELYAAAIIRSGKINTLRSEFGANGKNSIKEYGTVNDSIEFKALLEMDAYHHVKKGQQYPVVYLTGGMNDARVPAYQPAKFAARLQEANPNNIVFLHVDFDGGHNNDATKKKRNTQVTDFISFALWQTKHPDYQQKK